jgi:hypothetical protein
MELSDHELDALKDHLRITEKALRSIEHLAHGPASCEHQLVQQYALEAMARLQAARRLIKDPTRI